VSACQLARNSAYLGGGLFLSADLDPSAATLAVLNASRNSAGGMGPTAFWCATAKWG
jgi:hypothetical protein